MSNEIECCSLAWQLLLRTRSQKRKEHPQMEKRMLLISACYSGSWVPRFVQGTAEVAEERLIFTSVNSSSLSYVTHATNGLTSAFSSLPEDSNITFQQFLNRVSRHYNQFRYQAEPTSLLNERFIKDDTRGGQEGNNPGDNVSEKPQPTDELEEEGLNQTSAPDQDQDGIPDDVDQCDQTRFQHRSFVRTDGRYIGCATRYRDVLTR